MSQTFPTSKQNPNNRSSYFFGIFAALMMVSASLYAEQDRQSYEYHYGNGLIARMDEDGIQLFRKKGAQEIPLWSLKSNEITLQDNVDCELTCPPRYISFLTLDEVHGWVYFSVPLDQAQNIPILIYRSALKGGKPERLARTIASELSNGVVSPDGRYLAFTEGWHGSACYSGDNLEIVDMSQGRMITGPTQAERAIAEKQGDLVSARHLAWSSNSVISIKNEIYPNCHDGARSQKVETFDVTKASSTSDTMHQWLGPNAI